MILERERELAVLSGLVSAAAAGAGGIAAVVAPAGMGKTTLLASVRAEAEQAGFVALSAQGSQFEREFSFGLARQLFESVVRGTDLLDGAAGQAGAVLGVPDVPERGDFAILHGLYWLTANLCQQGPLLLCLDDLQWSDAASLRFVAHLLSRVRDLPLLVVIASRPEEPNADLRLIRQLVADPRCVQLQPAALGETAVGGLLPAELGTPEPEFVRACQTATGGNPFLIGELGRALLNAGLEPVGANAGRVEAVGGAALVKLASQRLTHLSPEAVVFARAMSLLEDRSDLAVVIEVAGLTLPSATAAMTELEQADILRPGSEGPLTQGSVAFAHPLMRAVVYESLTAGDRIAGHARAAEVLTAHGSEPEKVAGHLLLIPTRNDPAAGQVLRRAAADALRRGSPASATAYLDRCLAEPLADDVRLALLVELGTITQQSDMSASAGYLQQAANLAVAAEDRLRIADMYARALHFTGRNTEAVEVCRTARELPGVSHDYERRLDAQLLVLAISDMSIANRAAELDSARAIAPDATVGSRLVDGVIAVADAFDNRPRATVVERASRSLLDLDIRTAATGLEIYLSGCIALFMADADEGMTVLDRWVTQAYDHGSTVFMSYAKAARGIGWFWRGALAEAAADALEALEIGEANGTDVRAAAAGCLANALVAQGHLEEAAAALDRSGYDPAEAQAGFLYTLIESHAGLALARGDNAKAAELARLCGERYAGSGGVNPSRVQWRSHLATALHAAGQVEEAREIAQEEVRLARVWGAPRTLGRSLRVAGLIDGDLELLQESVAVLADSPARLEYATSLVDLGAALRRAGQRVACRPLLSSGIDLAEVCGAAPLARRGRQELRSTGVKARRTAVAGVGALTPSEARVVELATAGRSNRDIAQALFVTAKTVEVHLTNSYRKLGVSGRRELMARTTAPEPGPGAVTR
ncbi:AAA family ATPase [Kribbella sp. NPDC056861]|uniref:AAA family ATPase n=1 Tax=Kribbella sp. NPDC056861 TaxID=3154857 RepID=UPI0034255994